MLKMWAEAPGGGEVVAQLVERQQIKGFLKQAVIGPGEAAIIMRNGKIEDVLTQDKLKGLSGGLVNWFANKFGGGEDFQIMFISTVPIDLEIPLKGMLSSDHEEVPGTCTMRIQIDQANATKIINLMKKAEQIPSFKRGLFGNLKAVNVGKFLLRSDLEDKISGEAMAMVFSPQISKISVSEIRGNLKFIKDMETSAEVELRKSMSLWGINLVRFYTVWERTRFDELQRFRREKLQIYSQEKLVDDLESRKNLDALERDYALKKKDQEERWAMAYGGAEAKERISTMQAEAALKRDQMEADERLRQEVAKMRLRQEEKDIDSARAIKEEDADADRAMKMFEQVQAKKMARQGMAYEHTESIKRMDVDTQQMGVTTANEQIMTLQNQIYDLEQKMIDAPVEKMEFLQKLHEQKTAQLAVAQSEATKRQLGTVGGKDAAKAYMDAEGKKHEMGAYMTAEQRERQHHVDMTNEASKMMERSKQNVPQYIGGGYAGRDQADVNIVTVQQPSGGEAGGKKCPGCGESVKAKWKTCPECGGTLK